MLKSSINFNNENMVKESQNNRKKIQEKINKSEIDDFNICILEKNEININSNIKKYQEFFIKNPDEKLDLNNDDLILVYFYLYNKISTLTQDIVNKINIEKITTKNDIEEIRNFVTKIIDTTKKQLKNYKNYNIEKLFYLPIFKNLFNRLYYVRMYSYYLEGRYKDCLNDYQEYDEKIKVAYKLETPKSNEYIQKIVGNCYFKIKDYEKAEDIYDKIITIGTKDPLIYFNLGISAYLNKKIQKALRILEQSANIYKTESKNKNAKTVEELIAKIQKEKY
jgi:tetratricopeptide (TPR) repeat protein